MTFSLFVDVLRASLVTMRGETTGCMELEFEAEASELLDQMDIADAVSHFGEDELLEFIGKQKAMDYFNIYPEDYYP